MALSDPTPPTLADFLATFVRGVMGITTAQLPDASPVIATAYAVSGELTPVDLANASPTIYKLAVYNLGGSGILNYAQDPVPTVPYPPNSDSAVGFFAYTRKQYNLLGFTSGVISGAADESTSSTLVVPEAFQGLMLSNLQQLKDPYGRQWLSFVQTYGPAAWGVS